MSKSYCLPPGAPVLKYIDPDLLTFKTPSMSYSSSIISNISSTRDLKRPFVGLEEEDDPSDDYEMQMNALKNQPLAKMFAVNMPPPPILVPRKRGKDAKPVDQLDLKTGALLRRYVSQTDAVESMKVAAVYVSECCRGLRSDTVGFRWRWAEDAPPEEKNIKASDAHWVPISELLAIRNSEQNKGNFGVRFIKKEDGTIVDPRKEKRQLRLRTEEDGSEGELDEYDDDERLKPRGRARPVEQLDLQTGAVVRRYTSQMAAASAMMLNQYHVSMACRGAKREAGGFAWRSIDDDNVDLEDPSYLSMTKLLAMKRLFYENLKNVHKRIIEQVDINTGNIVRRYANSQEVIALLNVSSRALLKCLTGELNDAYGYIWRCYEGPEIDLEADNAQEGRTAIRDIIIETRKQKKKLSEMRRDSSIALDDFDFGDIEEIEEGDYEDTRQEVASSVKQARNPATSAIEQIDLSTGDVISKYANVTAAASSVHGMETFISKCVIGVVDEAYGFGWRYAEEDTENDHPSKMTKLDSGEDSESRNHDGIDIIGSDVLDSIEDVVFKAE